MNAVNGLEFGGREDHELKGPGCYLDKIKESSFTRMYIHVRLEIYEDTYI